jgi:hypothetical protein
MRVYIPAGAALQQPGAYPLPLPPLARSVARPHAYPLPRSTCRSLMHAPWVLALPPGVQQSAYPLSPSATDSTAIAAYRYMSMSFPAPFRSHSPLFIFNACFCPPCADSAAAQLLRSADLPEWSVLAVYLAELRWRAGQDPSAPWAPYLRLLPQDPGTVLSWPRSEVSTAAATPMRCPAKQCRSPCEATPCKTTQVACRVRWPALFMCFRECVPLFGTW